MNRTAASGRKALVTGGGGFIGHHLITRLRREGFFVIGLDLKRPEFEPTRADVFHVQDLREDISSYVKPFQGVDHVYHLASDMGGIGYIQSVAAPIFMNNMRIDMNVLEAARLAGVRRFFYASSACVYPESRTNEPFAAPLKEEWAYPAQPMEAYGWEKLMTERLCQHYREEFGLHTCVARFHTMYGPLGTWMGGREKFPAAVCRKVAMASEGAEIEIWGDGQQTRTFCYIDDCVEGVRRLMESESWGPVNLGSTELLSVTQAAELVIKASGKQGLRLKYLPGPQGQRGRAPDNTLCRQILRWEPSIAAAEGLAETYSWIEEQVRSGGGAGHTG